MTAPAWQRLTTAILAIYWIALAVATHLPKAPELPLEQGDKLLHVVAFTVLALLAATCWAAWRPKLHGRDFFVLFVILAVYAAVDELTQIPVGRQGDVLDWLADLAGIATGLSVFFFTRCVAKRPRPTH